MATPASRPFAVSIPSSSRQRADWVRRVREMPDLRLSRVSAIRDALERNRYEREEMVDRVIQQVAPDLR